MKIKGVRIYELMSQGPTWVTAKEREHFDFAWTFSRGIVTTRGLYLGTRQGLETLLNRMTMRLDTPGKLPTDQKGRVSVSIAAPSEKLAMSRNLR